MSEELHPSSHNATHVFAINATGTLVQIQFLPDGAPWQISGEQAKDLREFLNRCELRSEAEAAALGDAPPESDAGKGMRIDLNDGTHAYGSTPEEIATLQAKAKENHERIHAEFLKNLKSPPPMPEGWKP